MIQFFAWPLEWLWLFSLVLPLPWLIRWLFPPAPPNISTALKIPFYNDIAPLIKNRKLVQRPNWLEQNLARLIWLLLVLAAMRPQWLGEPIQIQVNGRDLMLAVDLSESMTESDLAANISPDACLNMAVFDSEQIPSNRLNLVKSVLRDFIERRKGDRLGLIVFGTKAYLQAPLTFDHKTVKMMLEEAFIGLAGKKTAIGDAIGLAIKHLKNHPQENKVLILLTDGNKTAGIIEPLSVAKLAKKYGVHVYIVGVGTDKVCQCDELGNCYFEKSSFELDEKTLQQIAEMTGGHYFRAKNQQELENIYAKLDKYEPVLVEQKTFRPKMPLYHWLLAIAFLISLILFFIKIGKIFKFK